MVGYNEKKLKHTNIDYVVAGSISGSVARTASQPLDVLKIRFQLQLEPISKTSDSKYKSMSQAFRLIVKEEGYRALWKGQLPAQKLSVAYGIAQFWSYEVLTKEAHKISFENVNKAVINFTCGAAAGCIATVASFPFDVLRTRFIALSYHSDLYWGLFDAYQQICRREGIRVLFRGILPTFIQIAPYTGVQFMSYTFFNNIYKNLRKFDPTHFTFSGSVISGALAGLCAKTVIYPLDLAKKRMQIQGIEHKRKSFGKVFVCKGMTECFKKTYTHEGVFGFFKGLGPGLLKSVIGTAINFSVYEYILKLMQDTKS